MYTAILSSFCTYIGYCYGCQYMWDPEDYKKRVKDQKGAIALSVSNLMLGTALLLVCAPLFDPVYQWKPSWHVLWHIPLLFFLSDTSFYWSHRMLHIPWVYKRYHKLHHKHVAPIPWTALYVHPGEFITAFVCIFVVPLLLVQLVSSIWIGTFVLFWNVIMISLVSSHSGFWVGNHHEMHHNKPSVNFGSKYGVWDKLCKTNDDYKNNFL